ncbi:MAG: hypothetical protein HWE18_06735 [Gammaproteobacteria bacterium]|nr:hypothetical protein [Gammaproteobacteria bacterium]
MKTHLTLAITLASASLLTACGGSSGSNNQAPVVSQVTINDTNTGSLRHKDLLQASYLYDDAEQDAEGTSVINWYIEDTLAHTGPDFTPGFDAIGKNITLAVRPMAATGTKEGTEVRTTIGPVIENETQLFVIKNDEESADDNNIADLYITDGDSGNTIKLSSALSYGKPVAMKDNWLIPAMWNLDPLFPNINVSGFLFTDGTEAGSQKIVLDNAKELYPNHLTNFGDKVLFSGVDDIHGDELWITDGTVAGTKQIKDLFDAGGGEDSHPDQFTVVGDQFYFSAKIDRDNKVLWVSDGTAEGTKPVEPTVYNPQMVRNFNGKLIVKAADHPDNLSALIAMVFDPAENTLSSLGVPNSTAVSISSTDSLIVITAGYSADKKIWVSKGVAGDAQQITSPEIIPNTIVETSLGLYMTTTMVDGVSDTSFWKINDVDDLENFSLNGSTDYRAYNPTVFNNTIFARIIDNTGDSELHAIDGSEFKKIADVNPNGMGVWPLDYYQDEFITVNGSLLFIGNDDEHGAELWATQGDESSTVLFKEFTAGTDSTRFELNPQSLNNGPNG